MSAIGLIDYARGIAASHERKVVSTALQSMSVDQEITQVDPLAISTNDMAEFPSRQYSLFPDYLDSRFSQFKYLIDNDGIVQVDTSRPTTDAFLDRIKQTLSKLEGDSN